MGIVGPGGFSEGTSTWQGPWQDNLWCGEGEPYYVLSDMGSRRNMTNPNLQVPSFGRREGPTNKAMY